jgi:hypothetical protein
MSQQPALTAEQQKLSDLWDAHLRAEFSAHAPDQAIATMVSNPLVNQVPVLTGGDGRKRSTSFMPNTSCIRSHRIWRSFPCHEPSAKAGWSTR